MKLNHIPLVVLLLSTMSLFAQSNSTKWEEGFVITKTDDPIYNGDTLWGQIAKPINVGNIFYKIVFLGNDGHSTKFQASEIIAVKIGSDYFESIKINDRYKFAIRLIEGPVSLYSEGIRSIRTKAAIKQQKSSYRGIFDYHIKKKGSNKFVKVSSVRFKIKMSEFFSDYAELSSQILQKKFKIYNIFEIVEKYNEWYINRNK